MKWDELVPKRRRIGGSVTSISIMDSKGRVLADLTNEVSGIDLGDVEIPVHHSGVAATVRFNIDGDELDMPTEVGALVAGKTIKVGT